MTILIQTDVMFKGKAVLYKNENRQDLASAHLDKIAHKKQNKKKQPYQHTKHTKTRPNVL